MNGTTLTTTELREARGWIEDCFEDAPADLTDDEVRDAIARLYEGGVRQFLVDSEPVETPTYRERRQAKAERLREWADSREQKAEAARARVDEIAGMIPLGQPILVGHHSESRHRRDVDRIHDGMREAIEHQEKADEFRRRADGIEKAADRAVYSDDSDAVAQLEARIAALEEERDIKKTANAAARKGLPVSEWGLTDDFADEAANNYRHWPGGTDVPFPNLKNLSANIRRNRRRLEELTT